MNVVSEYKLLGSSLVIPSCRNNRWYFCITGGAAGVGGGAAGVRSGTAGVTGGAAGVGGGAAVRQVLK